MKLESNTDEFTMYTCQNDNLFKEVYNDKDCTSPSKLSSTQSTDHSEYDCSGDVESCDYVKLLSQDTCYQNRYTIHYELINQIYATSNTSNYLSSCSDIDYSVTLGDGQQTHIKSSQCSLNGANVIFLVDNSCELNENECKIRQHGIAEYAQRIDNNHVTLAYATFDAEGANIEIGLDSMQSEDEYIEIIQNMSCSSNDFSDGTNTFEALNDVMNHLNYVGYTRDNDMDNKIVIFSNCMDDIHGEQAICDVFADEDGLMTNNGDMVEVTVVNIENSDNMTIESDYLSCLSKNEPITLNEMNFSEFNQNIDEIEQVVIGTNKVFVEECYIAKPLSLSPSIQPTIFYSTTTNVPPEYIINTPETSDRDAIFIHKEESQITDIYARIDLSMQVYIKSEFNIQSTCLDCFEWFLQDEDHSNPHYLSMNEYYGYETDEITFFNERVDSVDRDGSTYDVFESHMIISSVRTQNAGHCPDANKTKHHPLQPSKRYNVKLKVNTDQNLFVESDPVIYTTGDVPSGGECQVYYVDGEMQLFDRYIISCTGWSSNDSPISYNVLHQNVPLFDDFTFNTLPIQVGGPAETVITALIQDASSTISCYDIPLSLPPISSRHVPALTDELTNIIRSNETINAADLVSIFSTMRAVFACTDGTKACINPSTYKTYMDLTDELFEKMFEAFNHSNTPLFEEQMDEIAVLITATHPDAYIGFDVLQTLVTSYIPNVLQSLRSHHDDNLFAIAKELHRLNQNLDTYVSALDSDMGNYKDVLLQNSLHISHVALLNSYPGEIFNASVIPEKQMTAKRVQVVDYTPNSTTKCGIGSESIEIPNLFEFEKDENILNGIFDTASDSMFIDCSFVRIKHNESTTISVNVYQEGNKMNQKATDGNPYLITLPNHYHFGNATFVLNQNQSFPACKSRNSSNGRWSDDECFVYDINADTITCGCTHLNTHKITSEVFTPSAIALPSRKWRNISTQNFNHYPIIWMTFGIILTIIILLSGLKCIDQRKENRPLLAFEDIIFTQTRDERMKSDIYGRELRCIQRYMACSDPIVGNGLCELSISTKNLCIMQIKLFGIYLLNNHILLSIFWRPSGTNTSIKTRIGFFLMYLVNVMCLTVLFYVAVQEYCSDISAAIVISILSIIPIHFLQKLFVKSKPRTIKKSVFLFEHNNHHNIMNMDEDSDDDCSILDYSLNQNYSDSLHRLRSNSRKETMSTLDTAVYELKRTNSTAHRLQLVDDVRITLLNSLYPYPSYCKWIAWTILILWTLIAASVAIICSLQFDLEYEAELMSVYQLRDCWQNNRKIMIESELSQRRVDELNDALLHGNFMNTDIEGSESMRWLISCALSICFFMVVLQPLVIYICTWLKIWMFSWS